MAERSASKIEHEVEQTRSQVSATLDELRQKMAPGAMVDSMVSYASENGGADFFRNLGNQVRANPLPVALIGAGIAWLAFSGTRPSRSRPRHLEREYGNGFHDSSELSNGGHRALPRASNLSSAHSPGNGSGDSSSPGMMHRAASGVKDGAAAVNDTVSGVAQSVRSAAAAVSHSVSSAYETVTDTANHMGSRMAQGASSASSAMHSGYRSVQGGYERASDGASLLREQPLVTLALGVAVGAAIGAALPTTRAENEYLGEASDAAKERVREMASEQYSNIRETASNTVEAVKSEVDNQGLTSGSPTERLSGIGEKLSAVAGAAKSAMSEGVEKSAEALTSAKGKERASS